MRANAYMTTNRLSGAPLNHKGGGGVFGVWYTRASGSKYAGLDTVSGRPVRYPAGGASVNHVIASN